MLQTQTQPLKGAGKASTVIRVGLTDFTTPLTKLVTGTSTIKLLRSHAVLAPTELGALYAANELSCAAKTTRATNSSARGLALEVDAKGQAVLDAVLALEGAAPTVRNRVALPPSGASGRAIPTTIHDLAVEQDLGALAVALDLDMTDCDPSRALALLTTAKNQRLAGLAAVTAPTRPRGRPSHALVSGCGLNEGPCTLQVAIRQTP